MKRSLFLILISLMTISMVTSCKSSKKVATTVTASREKQEFRGAWIQTAWQDRYMGKTPKQTQAYLTSLIDNLYKAGFNAIIFQVRPEGDAFYESELEPWSRFLTGTQGKAPNPIWDPMAFVIDLCHQRHMEFHAWINPYRMYASKNFNLSRDHIYRQHPEWFTVYDEKLYLNPGLPESRAWIREVVKDIVTRYEVDAIHMDDYFYPYPAAGKTFDDKWAFENYGPVMGYDPTSRVDQANFRRRNVNILIKSVNDDIKAIKPWVRFGISPFGIYRNKKSWSEGSDTNGTQCYDDLYADVLLWAQSGWIDYVIPQIYWEIGHSAADYTTLCNWWAKHIPSNCHLYIGQSIERSLDGAANDKPVPDLRAANKHFSTKLNLANSLKEVDGNCFWYAYQIEDNQFHVRDFLTKNLFPFRAMPPAFTELNAVAPDQATGLDAKLVTTTQGTALHLEWKAPKTAVDPKRNVRYYNVYRFAKGEKVEIKDMKHLYAQVDDTELYDFDLTGSRKYTYIVAPVDYYNNEGKSIKKSFKIKLKR